MPLEYRAFWAGGVTGPAVTVVHGRDTAAGTLDQAAQELADRLRAFFADVAPTTLPDGITISFDTEALQLNTTTGVLESVHPVTPPANVVGGVDGNFAKPAGVRVEWSTPAIVMGRRLRGRTFLVPIAAGVFDQTGGLDETSRATIQAAAEDYFDEPFGIEAVAPSIWSRTHGIQADITGATVPDEASVLRSRRD